VLTSPEVLAATEPIEMDIAGFGTNIPPSHDMLKFAPPPLQQNGGTCVGFSAAYCAQSTMMNKASNTTMPLHKYILCMDPYLLYSIANSLSDDPCDEGLVFGKIFDMMSEIGNKRDLMPPSVGCDHDWYDSAGNLDMINLSKARDACLPFRIEKYGPINLERSDWLVVIKQFISNDIPIIIGANIGDDFSHKSFGGAIQDDGVYNYTAQEGEIGGHAMCILGYDNRQSGGAFLVRNSWGSNFGVKGNFWLKYRDFKKLVVEAWVVIPEQWSENIYSADDYNFSFKSTGVDGLDYGRADWNTSIYEGFYEKDQTVLAYELFNDGGIYFGQYLNYYKHGFGVYWNPDGERYPLEFNNGEFVRELAGFAGVPSSGEEMPPEISAILNDGGSNMEFVGEFPVSGYEGE
jgi:hypothetical protein